MLPLRSASPDLLGGAGPASVPRRSRQAHTKFIGTLAYVPGIGVVAGSEDGRISVWADGDEPIAMIAVHTAAVNAVGPGPEGGLLSASDDGTAIVWSAGLVPTQILVGHGDYVSEIAMAAPDRVVTAGRDGTVRVWGADGEPRRALSHRSWVNALAVSADGRAVYASSIDRDLRAWDADTGALLASFGEAGDARLLGHDIVLLGTNRSGTGHRDFAQALVVAPDGALWSIDREIVRWDPDTHAPTLTADLDGRSLWAAAFTDDPREIVVGGENVLRILDTETGTERARVGIGPLAARAVLVHEGQIWAGLADGSLVTMSLADVRAAGAPLAHTGTVSVIAADPRGRFVATAAGDCQTLLWDVASATPIAAFRRGDVFADLLLFLDDGRLLVGAFSGFQLIDPATGAARTASGHSLRLAAPLDPDHVLGAAYDRLVVWDLTTLTPTPFVQEAGFVIAITSVGARAFTVTHQGPLRGWGLELRMMIWERNPDQGRWTRVLAQGDHGLAATDTGHVEQLDLVSGVTLATFPSHPGGIWEAAIVDGVPTLAGGGVITTYDLAERRCLSRRPGESLAPRPAGANFACDVADRRFVGWSDGWVEVLSARR